MTKRNQARALRQTRYQRGVPCKHCGTDERYVSSDGCIECERIRKSDLTLNIRVMRAIAFLEGEGYTVKKGV